MNKEYLSAHCPYCGSRIYRNSHGYQCEHCNFQVKNTKFPHQLFNLNRKRFSISYILKCYVSLCSFTFGGMLLSLLAVRPIEHE